MSKAYLGGRGKKAPYNTCVLRVPTPLREDFEDVALAYKAMIEGDFVEIDFSKEDVFREAGLLSANPALIVPIVENILRQKKSAKVSLIKLLQVLYPNFNWVGTLLAERKFQ